MNNIKIKWFYRFLISIPFGVLYFVLLFSIEYFSINSNINLKSILFQSILFTLFSSFVFSYFSVKGIKKIISFLGLKTPYQPAQNETVLAQFEAHLFDGMSFFIGNLFVTDAHLVFVSHQVQIEQILLKIPNKEINDLIRQNNINNQHHILRISTIQGDLYDFELNQVNDGHEIIERQLNLG
jgi:hypothetical protein